MELSERSSVVIVVHLLSVTKNQAKGFIGFRVFSIGVGDERAYLSLCNELSIVNSLSSPVLFPEPKGPERGCM